MRAGIAQVGSAASQPGRGESGVVPLRQPIVETASIEDSPCSAGELEALAWIDLRTGAVLASSLKGEDAREAIELAAHGALQLCSAPCLDSPEADDIPAASALVVSERAIHAFARSKPHPDRALVGVARAGTNVALLLAWVRALADAKDEPTAASGKGSGREVQ